jgi:hypothetical protein
MDDVIERFIEKVREIDEYMNLLQQIDDPTAKIHRNGKSPKGVSNTALKTMKASCFLMLYNLVESSITESMTKLYEQMNNDKKRLLDFDECVKELWIEQKFSDMDPISSNQSSYRRLIKKMIEDVVSNSPVSLDPRKIHISGNLDARGIRNLFSLHKIPVKTHYRSFGGGELKTVKDKRISLAHGLESFAECGQQYTVQSILDIKKQTVVYLRSSLKNVRKYIEGEKYAA